MKSNLYLIIGESSKEIDYNLYNILNKIKYDEINKITYDMKDTSFSTILEEITTVSMFNSPKIVIVNNFNLDDITDFEFTTFTNFSSSVTDTYLILITKSIDGRKKRYRVIKDNYNVINITDSNITDRTTYVKDLIDSKGYKIDRYAFEYLVNRLGTDINNINTELNKLFIYKDKDLEITKRDIDLLIFDSVDNAIYEFNNAFLENNYNKIKYMYDKFKKDGLVRDYLISSLSTSLHQALVIKLLSNRKVTNSEIAKTIGKKEYYVKKSLEKLYSYTVDDLSNYILALADIDLASKSGNDNVDMFELFIYDKDKYINYKGVLM